MTRKPHRKHQALREAWVLLVALAALFASGVLAGLPTAVDDYRISLETIQAEFSAQIAEPDSH